jgi:uncharacterized protein YfiM (DUF2279 family)
MSKYLKFVLLILLFFDLNLFAMVLSDSSFKNNNYDSFSFENYVGNTTDKWFAFDKIQHFTTSLYLTTTVYYFQNREFRIAEKNSKTNSVCISLSLGIGKEIWDLHRDNHFSVKDLIADMAGTLTGLIIVNNIE